MTKTILLILAAVILASHVTTIPRYTESYDSLRSKWDLLSEARQPVSWLIVGDSTGLRGLNPAVITTLLGGRSINLCATAATTSLNDAWLLHYHIMRLGPPKHILIMRNLGTWLRTGDEEKPVEAWARVPVPLGTLSRLRPLPPMAVHDIPLILISRYLTPFALVSSHWQWPELRSPPAIVVRSEGFEGALLTETPSPENKSPRWHLDHAISDVLDMDPLAAKGMDEMVRLANRYDIDIFIVPNPWPEGLWSPEDLQSYGRGYDRLFQPYKARCPTLHVLTPAIALPASYFAEPYHLTYQGAEAFTRHIVNLIRGR